LSNFALCANGKNPLLFHRPRAWSAFAPDDDPRDAIQRELPNVFQKRFHGEETHSSRRCLKVGDSSQTVLAVLHRHTPPNVSIICRWPNRPAEQLLQTLGALREHLIGVPVRESHRRNHLLDIRKRHAFVEQITHRVDEYHAWLTPAQGFAKLVRNETQIEALLE